MQPILSQRKVAQDLLRQLTLTAEGGNRVGISGLRQPDVFSLRSLTTGMSRQGCTPVPRGSY